MEDGSRGLLKQRKKLSLTIIIQFSTFFLLLDTLHDELVQFKVHGKVNLAFVLPRGLNPTLHHDTEMNDLTRASTH
jgi:hypothetical protein